MKISTTTIRSLIVCCALTLAFAPGCSDDDSTGDNNNTLQDAGVDAAPDAGPQGESITFRVLDGDSSEDGTPVPLMGATVAVDLPGGERVEYTTDADGRVVVDGIDWSLGTMTTQAYYPGKGLVSFVAADASFTAETIALSAEGDAEFFLMDVVPTVTPPTYVEVTGSATGLVDPTNTLIVLPIGAPSTTPSDGPATDDYSFDVAANEEFTLLAFEYTWNGFANGLGYEQLIDRVMTMPVDPLLDATTIDIDLAAYETTLQTVDLSVSRNFRAESPLLDLPLYVNVMTNYNGWGVGWAHHSDVNTAGDAHDVTLRWTEIAGVEEPYTWYRYIQGNNELYSIYRQPGYPEAGTVPALLDIPDWIAPANPAMAHPLHDVISYEIFEDVTIHQLYLLKNNGNAYVVVQVVVIADCQDVVSFTIPEPPSTVDTAALYGTSPLLGQLVAGDPDANFEFFERYAVPELILVAP